MATMMEMAEAVRRARPASHEDADILVEASGILAGEQLLKVGQVANILGVSSPSTVRNWLERGYFAGTVLRTDDGTRLFRLEDVLAVKARMQLTRDENEAGVVEFTDYGDRGPKRYKRSR